jgi:hypothetical protein
MIGCLVRLFMAMVFGAILAVGYMTRDAWLPKLKGEITSSAPAENAKGATKIPPRGAGASVSMTGAAPEQWEALTPEAAARGRAAIADLNRKNGPVFVTMSGGDLAAFAVDSILRKSGAAKAGTQVFVRDDQIYVRGLVSAADLGGPKTLGPLTSLVTGKQQMTVRGKVEVLRPGMAQFRVDEIAVGDLKLPSAMIPKIVQRVEKKLRDPTIATNGIPLRVPKELADVRVAKGRITLYKSVP